MENKDELDKDLENITKMFQLLEMDYIGGHGTRGYGRVWVKNLKSNVIYENEDLATYNREL